MAGVSAIAAELLAALKRLEQWHDLAVGAPETYAADIAEARAVIAKAEHPALKHQRWKKRDLYDAIKPLRATGAAWDSIGAAIGVCGERCRQVWKLFDGDSKLSQLEVVADGTKLADH